MTTWPNRSRSDPVKVAVGFSPRIALGAWPRRVATVEKHLPRLMRLYATRPFPVSHRGLKPTATVATSLRDAAALLREQCRGMLAKAA